MSDLISRADALALFYPDTQYWGDDIDNKLLSLPSAEQHNKDAISREGLLRSWEELSPRGRTEFDQVIMTIPALPSADADEEDLIIKGAKGIQDGLYNIKDGKLFKYKANGGTVRTYPIVPSADAVQGANLINRHDAVTVIREECRKCNNMINDDLFMRIMSLPTSQQTDCTDFIMWLIEIVLDDEDWELNAVGYGEIIARKLKKLGLLEVKDGYYHRIFDENVWVVRCKDCEYADFNSPYPVCNFLEMNICENGYCSWARMKGGDE